MKNTRRQSHSLWKIVAAFLVVFFGVSLAPPCVSSVAEPVAAPVQESRFAAASPQTVADADDKVCACASCPGSHGGKCCCAAAPTPGEGYALRAVCDTAPPAASPSSPLPPIILPRTLPVIVPVIVAANPVTSSLLPRPRFAADAPLPPHAPPRLS